MERHGFAQVLRLEFTNSRSRRLGMISLLAVAAVFVLVSSVAALASHASNPAVPVGPDGEAVTDTYTFVRQSLGGEGTLTARLTSLSGAYASSNDPGANSQPGLRLRPGLAPWAKAGIILEPSTTPGTEYAAVIATGSYGVRMQYNYTHDRPGLAGRVEPTSPRWLRLSRAGDVITGYDSTDGAKWSEIGTARLIGLPRVVLIGLFVTSPLHVAAGDNNGMLSVATASFDNVSTQGDVSPSWTGDRIGGFYPSVQGDSTWQQPSADAFSVSGSGDIAPLVGDIVTTNWSGASIVDGTILALLIVIVLAASFATSEYRRGSIHAASSDASPHRVLAAKTIVVGSLAFATGAIATAIAELVTRNVLAANGIFLFPQSGFDAVRVVVGTGLMLGLAAVLVAALGTMLRRTTWTVVAGIALLVMPGVIATVLPADSESWLMRFTPTAAFAIQATLPRSDLVSDAYTIVNGYFPISPWGGLAVLAVYTAVALGSAMWLSHWRGATRVASDPGFPSI